MIKNHDSLFEVVKSLPATTHSVAIVTRSLSSDFRQPTKFMPDFGGVLETPDSDLKNNSLLSGLPFNPKPIISLLKRQHTDEPITKVTSNDCLLSSKLFYSDSALSCIFRVLGKDLHVDLLEDAVVDNSQVYITSPLALIPYINTISGLKCSSHSPEFLIIKFAQGVKTIKFNPETCDNREWDRSAFRYVFSTIERDDSTVKDSSLNQFNQSIQAIASDSRDQCHVKLYDLGTYTREPFSKISWISDESESLIIQASSGFINGKKVVGRVLRELVPTSPNYGIQQLDNIPNHLVNLMVTTSNKTSLIDPRINHISQVYVDKRKIPSFYPIEYIRKTEFSQKNSYQFYSLTNVSVRVFDTRYPCSPMNHVCHMLDSNSYDSMDMKTVNYLDSYLETLCLSSPDRLSFLAFNQEPNSEFINPKSAHLPFHQPNLYKERSSGGLFGLDIRAKKKVDSNENLFSVFQLTIDGDICISDYAPKDDYNINRDWLDKAPITSEEDLNRTLQESVRMHRLSTLHALEKTRESKPRRNTNRSLSKFKTLNILEISSEQHSELESKRAMSKYERMKGTFNGT